MGNEKKSKTAMVLCGIIYAVFLCVCIILFVGFFGPKEMGMLDTVLEWWSVLTCIMTAGIAALYGRYRNIKYPETLKLICTAAIIIWIIFPAMLVHSPWMRLVNAIFGIPIIVMSISYFIKRRKEKGKKGSMVGCLIMGIFIFHIVFMDFAF